MASLIYAIFKEDVMEGAAVLESTENVKCMLVNNYTVDGTAHVSYNDVSGQEAHRHGLYGRRRSPHGLRRDGG